MAIPLPQTGYRPIARLGGQGSFNAAPGSASSAVPRPAPVQDDPFRPKSGIASGGAPIRPMGTFKKGGRVKKTGVYKLHKGEQVAPSGSKRVKGAIILPVSGLLRARREK